MLRNSIVVLLLVFSCSAFAAGRPAALGWSLQNVELDDLRLTGGQGDVQIEDGALVFRLPPNQTAQWLLTTTPIWPDWFPVVKTSYRIDSAQGEYSGRIELLRPVEDGLVSIPYTVVEFRPNTATATVIQEQNKVTTVQQSPIDQISIELTSASSPLTFILFQLDIINPAIGGELLLKGFPALAPDETTPPPGWHYLALPDSSFTLSGVSPDANSAPLELRGSTISGKLFELHEDRRLVATSLPQPEQIEIDVNASGSDLFLLMGARLIGRELHQGFTERTAVRSIDWLSVEKRYSDGSVEFSFPFSIDGYRNEIQHGEWGVYHVAVDPTKTLRQVVIHDNMPFGQVYLAAATLNPGPTSMSHIQRERLIQTLPLETVTRPSAPQVSMNPQKQLSISNDYYQFRFDTQEEFSISSIKQTAKNREYLQNPSPLFSVIANGLRVPDSDWRMAGYELNGATVTFTLNNTDQALPLIAQVIILPTTGDACQMRLQINNTGATPTSLRVMFPAFQSISINDGPNQDIYFLPTERAAWGRGAIKFEAPHSGQMPQQWIDLYSDEHGCGLSIQTRDVVLLPKQFRMSKSDAGCRMGVDYFFDEPIVLRGGGLFETPSTIIQIHGGDWRTAFALHRDWVASLKSETASPNKPSDVFICWRDYPYRGSGLIYDSKINAYRFKPLFDELNSEFGGVDMIELAGWMQKRSDDDSSHPTVTTGGPNQLAIGSEVNLRRNIDDMNSLGVDVSLVANPYSPLDDFIVQDYSEYDINDILVPSGSVMQMNPNFEPWRDHASNVYPERASSLSASLYYDRVGLSSIDVLPGENALLQSTQANAETTAFFVERAPSDVSTLYIEGAHSYSSAGGRYPTQAPINLLRFTNPNLRILQKVHPSVYPHLLGPERAKLCVFQGEGLWLKGRPRSWYSQPFRQFIREILPIVRKHQDAFSSSDVEPMLPTGRGGLFANRFSTTDKHVITLYNNTHDTISGQLVAISVPNGEAALEYGLDDFDAGFSNEGVVISGRIHPNDVAIVVIEPDQPDVEQGTE